MRYIAVLTTRYTNFSEYVNAKGLSTFGCRSAEDEKNGLTYVLVQNLADANGYNFTSKVPLDPCWDRGLWNDVDRRIERGRRYD